MDPCLRRDDGRFSGVRCVLLLCCVFLTACTAPHYEEALPARFGSFEAEKRRAADYLHCEWAHGPADISSVQKFDFGCHGGVWGQATLLLDKHPNPTSTQVSGVRLMVRELTGSQLADDSYHEVGRNFISYVIEAYGPDLGPKIRQMFTDRQTRTLRTDMLRFHYTYFPGQSYNVHRLEINPAAPIETAF